MSDLSAWLLNRENDGMYSLTAPNGVMVFVVGLNTLDLLGTMFLDEVERCEEEGNGDEAEDLWG